MRPETLAVHAGAEPDAATGAVAPPIHLSTTFAHGPAAERIAGYEYQREGNPTQDRLETALAALEGGAAALAFGSGMAAMNALLESLPAGAHFVYPSDCYTGLRSLATEFLPERGVTATAVDFGDVAHVRAAITPSTRLIWAETPSNPQLRIADIASASFSSPAAKVRKYHPSFAHSTAIIATPNDAAGLARSGGITGVNAGVVRLAMSAMIGRPASPAIFAPVSTALT